MEELVELTKAAARSLRDAAVPYLRQALRFLALPYCMVACVNRAECPRSETRIASDLLYIFFRLGYYPDNYGKCRLWERPRQEWRFYYGSGYNPFQKALLSREVQRPEYGIIFRDKQVAQIVAEGLGIAMPRCRGTVPRGATLQDAVEARGLADAGTPELVAKPVLGAAGRAIYKIVPEAGRARLLDGQGEAVEGPVRVKEPYILQDAVVQHPELARINDRSLNTLRMLTYLSPEGEPRLLSAFVRFGVGASVIDNWSAGGVAVGVDLATGRLHPLGFNKRGVGVPEHPGSRIPFDQIVIPRWQEAVAFAQQVQAAFPFYRLLGLDVAVTGDGPLLIEINEGPDLVLQEQTSGPLLADPEVLAAFHREGLLTRSMSRQLAGDIRRATGAA